MRILGEGGADAPSSGQDGERGLGRGPAVLGRFATSRPALSRVRPRSPPAQVCLRPSTRPVPEFPRRMPERRRERNAIPPTGGTARRTGAPRGRTGSPAGAHAPYRRHTRCYHGISTGMGVSARRLRKGAAQAPRTTRRLLRASGSRTAFFGQLLSRASALPSGRANTSVTCGSTMPRVADVAPRGRSDGRRTSLRASRVKRFVIECFTPRCVVDIASGGKGATGVPPGTVDLILDGLAGGTCRTEVTTRRFEGG
jgi:hypothetical protein